MDSSKQDYQYLRPPKEVFDIKHSDDYASRGEGNQSLRKIFTGVPFTDFEREKLADFKKLVRNENLRLPSGWTDADYMRYVYSGRFNLEKCLDNLKTHIQWRSDPKRVVLGEKATKMIKDGLVYISGRDRQYRPIIIINVYKIDLKSMDMEDFNDALCFVLDVARNYYFVPGKVENWILIIETNSLSVFNFPFKVFKGIVQATGANFPCTSEKMFITNPSRLFGASWNVAKGMLDPVTASKISVLTKDQFNDFFQYIAPEQLEQRYGGRLANPVSYWPPVNTLNKPSYIQGQEKGANVMASINLFGRVKSSQIANQEQNDQINEKTVYYDFDSSTESLNDLKDENNGETNFYSMESLDPRDQLSPKSYQETAQRKKFSVFFNPKTSVKPKKINLDDSLNGSDTSIASEKASEICRQMISMKSFHNNIACGGPRLRPSRPFERKGISKFGK